MRKFFSQVPALHRLYQRITRLRSGSVYPAGHFYSTITDPETVRRHEADIWREEFQESLPGIDLHPEEQEALLKAFIPYYAEMPFQPEKQEGLRYHFDNPFYAYTDGITLYGMIRHFRPKRIIEVGSGFSSAVMLDTNERFFNNAIALTFIEPFPVRLNNLISEADKRSTEILVSGVQSVPLETFDRLEAGDFLFIDSSHVVKTGSDVQHLFFQVLPRLKPGVLIHIHDVFHPFEYPRPWVYAGRNWNEDHFLRAFLMYNNAFRIRLFSHYLHQVRPAAFEALPLCYRNKGGNIWLERS